MGTELVRWWGDSFGVGVVRVWRYHAMDIEWKEYKGMCLVHMM